MYAHGNGLAVGTSAAAVSGPGAALIMALFLMGIGVIIAVIVALLVAGIRLLESRHRKRSSGQLPPRSSPARAGRHRGGRHLAPRPGSSRRLITVNSTLPKRPEATLLACNRPARGHRGKGALAGCSPQSGLIAVQLACN